MSMTRIAGCLVALAALRVHGHDDVSACVELVAEGDRWHLANRCEYGLDVSWCPVEDGECIWKGKQSMSAAGTVGDSFSTGYPTAKPLNGHVVACRNDPPDYGGMWGTVDQGSGRYWCLDPHFEEVDVAVDTRVEDDTHCIESVRESGLTKGNNRPWSHVRLANKCDYDVHIAYCYANADSDRWHDIFVCGHRPGTYYRPTKTVLSRAGWGQDTELLHGGAEVELAACRYGFDPEGWDGEGGYRCKRENE